MATTRKAPSPFSVRFSVEEREKLERDAAGMPIGAYIRLRVLGDEVAPRRTRGKAPVKDHQALARVLSALGASKIPNNLNQLARAANIGALVLTPEVEEELLEALAAVRQIRADLMQALGHREKKDPASLTDEFGRRQ